MNKKGKEISFWVVGAAVVGCSFCQYLYNAFNDYGVCTNSLNEMIAAQADSSNGGSTSGGGSSSGGDGTSSSVMWPNHVLRMTSKKETVTATEEHYITIGGKRIFGKYVKGHKYEVLLDVYTCEEATNVSCNTEKQRSEVVYSSQGGGTTSDNG